MCFQISFVESTVVFSHVCTSVEPHFTPSFLLLFTVLYLFLPDSQLERKWGHAAPEEYKGPSHITQVPPRVKVKYRSTMEDDKSKVAYWSKLALAVVLK